MLYSFKFYLDYRQSESLSAFTWRAIERKKAEYTAVIVREILFTEDWNRLKYAGMMEDQTH